MSLDPSDTILSKTSLAIPNDNWLYLFFHQTTHQLKGKLALGILCGGIESVKQA
jgi:hypothetical protein